MGIGIYRTIKISLYKHKMRCIGIIDIELYNLYDGGELYIICGLGLGDKRRSETN